MHARVGVMAEVDEVQEGMKANIEAMKRTDGHNDGGHDEHEEDNGGQYGYSCHC